MRRIKEAFIYIQVINVKNLKVLFYFSILFFYFIFLILQNNKIHFLIKFFVTNATILNKSICFILELSFTHSYTTTRPLFENE
jgi:hypothetical protein